MAQALGGLVRPRSDPVKHYALQESELLVTPEGSVAVDAISTAIAVLARNEGSDLTPVRRGKRSSDKEQTRLKLLYHHDDEVGGGQAASTATSSLKRREASHSRFRTIKTPY